MSLAKPREMIAWGVSILAWKNKIPVRMNSNWTYSWLRLQSSSTWSGIGRWTWSRHAGTNLRIRCSWDACFSIFAIDWCCNFHIFRNRGGCACSRWWLNGRLCFSLRTHPLRKLKSKWQRNLKNKWVNALICAMKVKILSCAPGRYF